METLRALVVQPRNVRPRIAAPIALIAASLISTCQLLSPPNPHTSSVSTPQTTTPQKVLPPLAGTNVTQVAMIASLSGRQSEENVWLTSLDTGELTQITSDAKLQIDGNGQIAAVRQYRDLAWSPRGLALAFVESSYSGGESSNVAETLWLYDLETESLKELTRLGNIAGFDWSPDGTLIAFGRDIPDMSEGPLAPGGSVHGIWTVDVDSLETREVVAPERGFPLARPKWSPDGRYLAFEEVQFIEGNGLFALHDTTSGSYVAWDRTLGSYDWSSDSEHLVYDGLIYAPEPGARIWSASKGGGVPIPLTPDEPGMASLMPSVSRTGDMIAFFCVDPNGLSGKGSLWVMAENGGERREVLSELDPQPVAWDPKTEVVVVELWGEAGSECIAVDIATSEVRHLGIGASCALRLTKAPG